MYDEDSENPVEPLTEVNCYYHSRGIDGQTEDDFGVDVPDPFEYALRFVQPIGVMTGLVDVSVEYISGDEWLVTVKGEWRSLGEPYSVLKIAEFYADESEVVS